MSSNESDELKKTNGSVNTAASASTSATNLQVTPQDEQQDENEQQEENKQQDENKQQEENDHKKGGSNSLTPAAVSSGSASTASQEEPKGDQKKNIKSKMDELIDRNRARIDEAGKKDGDHSTATNIAMSMIASAQLAGQNLGRMLEPRVQKAAQKANQAVEKFARLTAGALQRPENTSAPQAQIQETEHQAKVLMEDNRSEVAREGNTVTETQVVSTEKQEVSTEKQEVSTEKQEHSNGGPSV